MIWLQAGQGLQVGCSVNEQVEKLLRIWARGWINSSKDSHLGGKTRTGRKGCCSLDNIHNLPRRQYPTLNVRRVEVFIAPLLAWKLS